MKQTFAPFLLLIFCLFGSGVQGQHTWRYLSPAHTPIYYNPAFAGSLEQGRLALTTQSESIIGDPYQYGMGSTFSYDQRIDRLKGGLGAIVNLNQKRMHWNGNIGVMYSPKFRLSPKLCLAPGVAFNFGFVHGERQGKIRFGTPRPILIRAIEDSLLYYPDASVGVLLNGPQFYIGVGITHLLQPNADPYPEDDHVAGFARNLNLQVGYTLSSKQADKWALSLQGLFTVGNGETMAQPLLSFRYKSMVFGVGLTVGNFNFYDPYYHDPEGFFTSRYIFNIGYKRPRYKLSLTYSPALTTPTFVNSSVIRTAEFSFIYYLFKKG